MMWVDEPTYLGEKLAKGWYAIHYCWDTEEGSFISSDYFDGEKWRDDRPLWSIAGPFATEDEAQQFGVANDISW